VPDLSARYPRAAQGSGLPSDTGPDSDLAERLEIGIVWDAVAEVVAQICSNSDDLIGRQTKTPPNHSTVTDFARLRGLSMSQPFFKAT
jgi:hypothetical protein